MVIALLVILGFDTTAVLGAVTFEIPAPGDERDWLSGTFRPAEVGHV